MSDCCSTTTSKQLTANASCPACSSRCLPVITQTLYFHVKEPWLHLIPEHGVFICVDANCSLVYFSEEGLRLQDSDLRTVMSYGANDERNPLCYCFGVTLGDYLESHNLKNYVVEMTRKKQCACDTHNPSGHCCLKYFPKIK